MEDATAIPYSELPGFPAAERGGARRAARWPGSIGGVPVVAFQGRAHLYEGVDLDELRTPVRALQAAGAEILVLTNAAGSLRADLGPGSLMLIDGPHQPDRRRTCSPAPTTTSSGPRFPSLRDAYDPRAARRLRARRAASSASSWPRASTSRSADRASRRPAEIRAFHTLGADAVGMSTVHETIVARHCGLRVAAVSAITNFAEGMGEEPVSHEQTLRDAAARGRRPGAADHALRREAWLMHVAELIRRKRDGGELTDEELGFLVRGHRRRHAQRRPGRRARDGDPAPGA